jgi:hypothetical protein
VGGCLQILRSHDPRDVVAELPPKLGTASVLVRSERSWHAVSPVTRGARSPRRSLAVTWFRAGAVSPAWRLHGDGTVRSIRDGVPLEPRLHPRRAANALRATGRRWRHGFRTGRGWRRSRAVAGTYRGRHG